MITAMIIMLVLSLAMMAASMLLMPKPARASFAAGVTPTSQSGMPIPVIVGTVLIKDPNCLGWWNNQINSFKTKV